MTLQKDEVSHLYGPSDFDALTCDSPKVCIGAGTGLGECYLTPSSDGTYTCFPSEGGHVEYAPRCDLEVELLQYLSDLFNKQGHRRVSVERIVSGKGLANVYDFLSKKFRNDVDTAIHDEFIKSDDTQGQIVGENAATDKLCRQAMDIMMSAYGCEAGSAALKWIPRSGLFITGGLTPKNIVYIKGEDTKFMESFVNKGRLSPLLESIPTYAVMVEDLGIRGAHKAAMNLYTELYYQKSN